MNMEYAVERCSKEVIEEMKPLLEAHYEEIARNQDKIKLNPDYDLYAKLDELGMLHGVSARADGELIGYFLSIVGPNMHYKDHLMAKNDIMFIRKDYRNGLTPVRLLKYAEETLKARGVSVMYLNVKLAHDFGRLMEYLGWVETERIYEKILI